MAIDWNPSYPAVVGAEVDDTGYSHRVVDAPHDVAALRFTARHTGPLTHWELHSGPGASAGGLSGRYGELRRPVMLEMVPAGQEATAGATYTDFPVSALVGTASMFNANLTKPIVPSQLATPNDGAFIVSSKRSAYFEANFSTAAFPLTWHVLAVEVRMRINLTTGVRRIDPSGEPWFYDVPEFSPQYVLHTVRWGEGIVDGADSAWSHWTPAKVRQFASTRKVRFACLAGPGQWRMDWLQLRVHHVPERRRAVGFGMPAFPYSWVSFPMTTPNATGSPSVTNGESLTLMCRRMTDYSPDVVGGQAVMPWRHLRGRSPAGDWAFRNQPWPSWSEGFDPIGGVIEGVPAARAKNGSTVVATSQPYQLTRGLHVYGSQLARQRLTMPSGQSYGQAYVVCGWNQSVGAPLGPLAVEVRRVSTGAVVFSSTEVTSETWRSAPDSHAFPGHGSDHFHTDDEGVTYKRLRVRFPETTTLTAAQYEVRVSSPESSSERPWYVAAMIGAGHSTDSSYGGSTDYASGLATLEGAATEVAPSGAWTADAMVTLATVPAAVTGLTAAVGARSAHDASICTCDGTSEEPGGCAEDSLPYTYLEWDAAPTGSPAPAGYFVERTDDRTPGWERVAYVDGRTTTTWEDDEPRIGLGVASSYRVQVVREDGLTGDWSNTASVSIPAGQVALAFSSNAAQAMGCVYPEVWEGAEVERGWSQPRYGDVAYRRMYGRHHPVAFRPMERQGRQFRRTLLVSAGCLVASPSLDVYQPLHDLAWAAVPYVCVRDGEGNRWYASVLVPDELNRRADANGHELWLAEVELTEVSDVPYAVDTSVAQVTGPAEL